MEVSPAVTRRDRTSSSGAKTRFLVGISSILACVHRFWNHIIRPLIETLKPTSILEIGARDGDMTTLLCGYCREHASSLTCIDPLPLFDVPSYQSKYGKVFHFIQGGVEALPRRQADIVLLDLEPNWHMVVESLRSIHTAHSGQSLPIVLIHDAGWPYARRDLYPDPERIPPEARQPFARGGVKPGMRTLLSDGGLHSQFFHACTEGGTKNGVLTAIEDIVRETGGAWSLTVVPGFFGLALLVPIAMAKSRPEIAAFLRALPKDPSVAALEKDRICALSAFAELQLSAARDRRRNREDHSRLTGRIRMLEAQLSRIHSTRSWKITAPLRKLPAFIRSLRGGKKKAPQTAGESATAICGRHFSVAPVSVIITGPSHMSEMKRCVESIQSQTIAPLELLFIDDESDAERSAFAATCSGMNVIRSPKDTEPGARIKGAEASIGSYLLWIHADDFLPETFLADLLAPMLSDGLGASFAYGSTEYARGATRRWSPPIWSLQALWKGNFVRSCALVRRAAYEAVGGMRNTVDAQWDLFLRMARIGPGIRTAAVMRSVTPSIRQKDIAGAVRRHAACVSVCAHMKGTIPALLGTWVDALAATVSQSLVPRPDLVLLVDVDASIEQTLSLALARHEGVFASVTIVSSAAKEGTNDVHLHAIAEAAALNRLLAATDADIVWFVGENVAVPPDAYESLLRLLTEGDDPPAAATGLCRSRSGVLAHRLSDGWKPAPVEAEQPVSIDLTSTQCLMIFRPIAPHLFASHCKIGMTPNPGWAWSAQLPKNERILLAPSIVCRTYVTLDESY